MNKLFFCETLTKGVDEFLGRQALIYEKGVDVLLRNVFLFVIFVFLGYLSDILKAECRIFGEFLYN